MKRNVYLIVPFIVAALVSLAQRPTIELTFTAVDSAEWVQLDSVKVMNRTQGSDTVLYYPDTVLVLHYTTGIDEIDQGTQRLEITAMYPNPTTDHSTVTFHLPASGMVSIVATDIQGRVVAKTERSLQKGQHSFRFVPGGEGMYLVQVRWNGQTRSVKIQSSASGRHTMAALNYMGSGIKEPVQKKMKVTEGFRYSLGDDLLCIGYVDTLESGILNTPSANQTYTFQFAYNKPCPGTPTVTYEGQVYNTVQIFSQCWLKENLNVGTMIPGSENMTDNDTIEKYCYENEPDSCAKYGGLYQWDEMMKSTSQQGVRGICPDGWHVPSDEEWKILEGAADSFYGIGNDIWNDFIWVRGHDVGVQLKSTAGWYQNGNGTDKYGFSGLPGGWRRTNIPFSGIGGYGGWWASDDAINPWCRFFIFDSTKVSRDFYSKDTGLSVRCIRDEPYTSRSGDSK